METLQYFLDLPQGTSIQAEYVWIGGTGLDLRSKTKTIENGESIKSASDLPEWNFDGSSTNQAPGDNSEIWLRPVKIYPDPFRTGKNILVLCECLDPSDMSPIPTNKRSPANEIFSDEKVKHELPWYGIEQEYFLYDADNKRPLGWPKTGYPAPQGPYYCAMGTVNTFGRNVVEAHYRACLYCGLKISGINAEVAPGQWEYQIGPCLGIDSGDQLWLSRYLLIRIAEMFGVNVRFDAKPIKGDWNGSGAHHNYSTLSMRSIGGYDHIESAIKKLQIAHMDHMEVYGKTNRERLTGLHETAKYDQFSYGVANRGASIRIPRQTYIDRKGYLEDRRPAADVDPYESTAIIARTTILT